MTRGHHASTSFLTAFFPSWCLPLNGTALLTTLLSLTVSLQFASAIIFIHLFNQPTTLLLVYGRPSKHAPKRTTNSKRSLQAYSMYQYNCNYNVQYNVRTSHHLILSATHACMLEETRSRAEKKVKCN